MGGAGAWVCVDMSVYVEWLVCAVHAVCMY